MPSPEVMAIGAEELLKCSACANYYTTDKKPPSGSSSAAAERFVNRIPVMLPCCGNTVCSACAEQHRASRVSELMKKMKRNQKQERRWPPKLKIDCTRCEGSFCLDATEFVPNRLVVALIRSQEKVTPANISNQTPATKKLCRREDHEQKDDAAAERKKNAQQAAAAHALDVAKKRSETAKSNWDGAKESYENVQGLVAAAEEKVERARQALNTAKAARTKAAVALGNATYDKEDMLRLYKELLGTKRHGADELGTNNQAKV